MTTIDMIHLPTIDDYLGDAADRFFGDGYRQVHNSLRNIEFDHDGGLRATAAVVVAGRWSTKAAGAVTPHLSTIDAIVIAARLATLHVRRTWQLGDDWVSALHLSMMDIRAGTAPLEDGLGAVPVGATLRDSHPDVTSRYGRTSTFECRVGPMVVRCVVDHANRRAATQDRASSTVRHTTRRLAVTDVFVRPAEHRGIAVVTPSRTLAPQPVYAPWTPMVEAFVATMQMGQVLLYELDGIQRADSDTMWMRRTVLAAEQPLPYDEEPFPVDASLSAALLVHSGDSSWRTSTVRSDCHGVRVRCDLTHRLSSGSTP
jgi:hypothetical protein